MEKFNNSDFVKLVSKETGYAQKDIKAVLEAVSDVALDIISRDDAVVVFPGLTLTATYVPETTRRNPRTGEAVLVQPHHKPKAKFGAKYKEALK